jgi:hypothetical protein
LVAIGFGLLWLAYTGGLEAYCLLRGYNVTFAQLINPVHPYSGPWPPQQIPTGVIFPTGNAKVDTTATAAGGTGKGKGKGKGKAPAPGGSSGGPPVQAV